MADNFDGAWLKEWRGRNGYTQDELAMELDVSRPTIVKWERSATIDHLVVLALVALENIKELRNISGRKSMKGTSGSRISKAA